MSKLHVKHVAGRIRQHVTNYKESYRKPGRDCRGSSLIEVIVAMLVLALIIVPMLDMFANASRINSRARGRQHANAVLENVLEELRAENFTFVYEVGDAASEDFRDIGNRLRLCNGAVKDDALSGKSFLTGVIPQGTREYQAEIRFSADEYRGGNGLNDYEMPDINSYDSSNSEMLLLDAASDAIIVDEFYRQYVAQEQAEYQQRLNEEWMQSEAYLFQYEFNTWYEKWLSDNNNEEPPMDYKPPAFDASEVPPSNPLGLEEFRTFVRKKTEVKIEDSGLGDYAVNYTVSYTVDATADELRLEESFQESYQYEAGSGSRFTAEKLDFIYIFYQPFTEDRAQEELVIDATEISVNPDWESKLYLAVQGDTSGPALKVTVEMDVSLSPVERDKRMSIMTASGLDTGHTNVVNELVPKRAREDTVYCVTVKIRELGSSEVVAEAKTTLYYE